MLPRLTIHTVKLETPSFMQRGTPPPNLNNGDLNAVCPLLGACKQKERYVQLKTSNLSDTTPMNLKEARPTNRRRFPISQLLCSVQHGITNVRVLRGIVRSGCVCVWGGGQVCMPVYKPTCKAQMKTSGARLYHFPPYAFEQDISLNSKLISFQLNCLHTTCTPLHPSAGAPRNKARGLHAWAATALRNWALSPAQNIRPSFSSLSATENVWSVTGVVRTSFSALHQQVLCELKEESFYLCCTWQHPRSVHSMKFTERQLDAVICPEKNRSSALLTNFNLAVRFSRIYVATV